MAAAAAAGAAAGAAAAITAALKAVGASAMHRRCRTAGAARLLAPFRPKAGSDQVSSHQACCTQQ